MKTNIVIFLSCLLIPGIVTAGGKDDDPFIAKFTLDRLELIDGDDTNPVAWEASAWLGRDLEKFWFENWAAVNQAKFRFQPVYIF